MQIRLRGNKRWPQGLFDFDWLVCIVNNNIMENIFF